MEKSFLQQAEELTKCFEKPMIGWKTREKLKQAKELKEKILKGCGDNWYNKKTDMSYMCDEYCPCPNCIKAIKKVNKILGEQE